MSFDYMKEIIEKQKQIDQLVSLLSFYIKDESELGKRLGEIFSEEDVDYYLDGIKLFG